MPTLPYAAPLSHTRQLGACSTACMRNAGIAHSLPSRSVGSCGTPPQSLHVRHTARVGRGVRPLAQRGSLTQGGGVEHTRTVLRQVIGQERGQLLNVAVEHGRRTNHVRRCDRTQLTPAFFILARAPLNSPAPASGPDPVSAHSEGVFVAAPTACLNPEHCHTDRGHS